MKYYNLPRYIRGHFDLFQHSCCDFPLHRLPGSRLDHPAAFLTPGGFYQQHGEEIWHQAGSDEARQWAVAPCWWMILLWYIMILWVYIMLYIIYKIVIIIVYTMLLFYWIIYILSNIQAYYPIYSSENRGNPFLTNQHSRGTSWGSLFERCSYIPTASLDFMPIQIRNTCSILRRILITHQLLITRIIRTIVEQ